MPVTQSCRAHSKTCFCCMDILGMSSQVGKWHRIECNGSPVPTLPHCQLCLHICCSLVVWPGMLFPNSWVFQATRNTRFSSSFLKKSDFPFCFMIARVNWTKTWNLKMTGFWDKSRWADSLQTFAVWVEPAWSPRGGWVNKLLLQMGALAI